jgi:cytochrome o ubiquinol oxidase subunit 2
MTNAGYAELVKPSTVNPQLYSSFPDRLFEKIVAQYASGHQHSAGSEKGSDGETPADSKHDMDGMNMDGMDMGGMNGGDHSGHAQNGSESEAMNDHSAH